MEKNGIQLATEVEKKHSTLMRQITKIVIHCSATKAGQNWKKDDIAQWHKQRRFPATGGTCCEARQAFSYKIRTLGH